MTSSQQEAEELLREWQERRGLGNAPERRLETKREKINDGEVTLDVKAGLALFVFLVSFREELRAREGAVTRVKRQASRLRKRRAA